MKKTIFLVLVLVLAALPCWAQNVIIDTTINHTLLWSGHYLKNISFTPAAEDSMRYFDTLVTDDDDTVVISWTSHPQKIKVTPTFTADYVYDDTIVFGAVKVPFTWTAPHTGGSAAMVVDSVVAYGNATNVIKDSVRFEDSATYFVIRDKKATPRVTQWSTACPSRLADTATVNKTTAAMVCDSMAAKVNANSTLASVLTAYDSTTYYHIKADDSSEVFEYLDGGNDSQTVAVTSAANVEWTDTTWYRIMRGMASYEYLWAGMELDVDFGGLASSETLWVNMTRVMDTGHAPASFMKAGVIRYDSLFTTTGWNLESYLRAATAGDSTMRYNVLWLRVITRSHLKDSGAALTIYRDSTWNQAIHVLARGINGNKVR